MKLNKNELTFIERATRLGNAVFDYENNDTNRKFKKAYGMTIKQSEKMIDNLGLKAAKEILRLTEDVLKINSWTTGIHLLEYKTNLPDGTICGFDADWGEVCAYKGDVVPIHRIPRTIKLKRLKRDLIKDLKAIK